MKTPWGYKFTEPDGLDDLISVGEFHEYTGSKYASDDRTLPNIRAASAAIRNYCGWHIYPERECEFETNFFDKHVSSVASGIMVQLPATYITSIVSVVVGSDPVETYVLETDGILRICGTMQNAWDKIRVRYIAGLPEESMDAIRELAAHRVTHALANSYGIQSETAGGLSITYSANWANSARATALADDNKEVLMPYKLTGVF